MVKVVCQAKVCACGEHTEKSCQNICEKLGLEQCQKGKAVQRFAAQIMFGKLLSLPKVYND